jgi:type II secretory pathway pseudopilin PulG
MPAPSYPVQGGIPPYAPPAQPQRKRNPLLTIIIAVIAAIVVIGAAATFFIVNAAQQQATRNTNATATAVSATSVAQRNATATAIANNANATATANAQGTSSNPYGGTVVLDDSLKDNSGGHGWQEDGNCKFTQSVYETNESSQNTFLPCFAKSTNFNNLAFEVGIKVISGDCGGVVVRANTSSQAEYYYEICTDGTYALVYYDGSTGKYLIQPTSSSSIKSGANAINVIALVANAGNLQLYANGTSIDQAQDTNLTSGSIGLLAINHKSSGTTVAYAGVRVWQL